MVVIVVVKSEGDAKIMDREISLQDGLTELSLLLEKAKVVSIASKQYSANLGDDLIDLNVMMKNIKTMNNGLNGLKQAALDNGVDLISEIQDNFFRTDCLNKVIDDYIDQALKLVGYVELSS